MQPAITSSPLYLASHVRARECGRQVVLLDLRKNRYVGVGPAVSSALSRCVHGWPSVTALAGVNVSSTVPMDIRSTIRRFESEGLLSPTSPQCALIDSTAIAIGDAQASLDFEDLSTEVEASARRVMHFLRGSALTAWKLRYQSLETIARAVSERRRRIGAHDSSPLPKSAAPTAAIRSGAIAYERLRPYLLTARERCLFDSMSMLEFLAAEGLFPHLIIGVKTAPFGAHAWVQCGPMVLNDQHARVRQFRPILVA
ncbi:lasso peptide biosynthesis B2 protein [Paucibacter sp. R3-3]|uniref:Lasso peptide biosynthesis B2 protein n=1 Tax=Roseateles agri TaxID=3098619 RepID=A0ABU5DTE1_9BURK|nr:lasso peptide biosynthesis B2 protein [Paucibacter sp. R3-3]MDY0749100.1 lasso peptide biosynthesis B2 protein [Paucibacter sp. R3-3]